MQIIVGRRAPAVPGLVGNRETSLGTLEMWETWNGVANDRIRGLFGARTPGGR